MEKRYYTVSEFAELTGRTTQTIYKQIQTGRLKPYSRKIGGVRKIRADALELYKDDPEPQEQGQEQEQPQADQEQDVVALLREQIRILSDTLEHERQTLEHEREAHKQTLDALKQEQEALRQTQELMKAQMVQYALTAKQKPEEVDPEDQVPGGSDKDDPEPQAGMDPEPKGQPQTQPQPAPENQRPERRGFLSRLFGR